MMALVLSVLTSSTSFEISNRWKRKPWIRFLSLFLGWSSFAYFTVAGLYYSPDQPESKFFTQKMVQNSNSHIKNTSNHENNHEQPVNNPLAKPSKEIVKKESSNSKPNSLNADDSSISIAFICSIISVFTLLGCLVLKARETTPQFPLKENREKYHRNIKLWIRFYGKLGFSALLIFFLLTISVYITTNGECNSLIIGISILSSVFLYQVLNSSRMLQSFQRPNEFERQRLMLQFGSIFPLFIGSSFLIRLLISSLSSSFLSGILSLISFFLAFLGYKGISISKLHQHNTFQRSLVTFPIAIKLKNKGSLNRKALYDAISKQYPQSQIYFEKISTGFKERQAEITVVNWETYEEEKLEEKRKELHKTVIQAINPKANGIEILNFEIEYCCDRKEVQIESVTPIERTYQIKKGIVDFCKKKTSDSLKLIKLK